MSMAINYMNLTILLQLSIAYTIINEIKNVSNTASVKFTCHEYYGTTSEMVMYFSDFNFDINIVYHTNTKPNRFDLPNISIGTIVSISVLISVVASTWKMSQYQLLQDDTIAELTYSPSMAISHKIAARSLHIGDWPRPLQVNFY